MVPIPFSNPKSQSTRQLAKRICALSLGALLFNSTASFGQSLQKSKPSPDTFEDTVYLNGDVLSRQIAKKKLSVETLANIYAKRIAQVDDSGPTLNAVVELNPDYVAIAKELDSKSPQSALHGLPVLLKDNIDTGDKMLTTAGSLALMNNPAKNDAFIVKQLRESGALIFGKTNLSEWANFRSSPSISGWSGRGGQTKNAFVTDRSPCGSSSGSAVAVAAGFAPLAIGTETDGSILCPSSMNGIVGIKPTLGLVSRSGIIPLSHSQDTAGPMAKTVTDAAMLLSIIAGTDRSDPYTAQANKHKRDFAAGLSQTSLQGKRLGIVSHFTGRHEGTDAVFAKAVTTLEALGAELVEVDLPNYGEYSAAEFTVLLYDFKHDINQYLAKRGDKNIKNLDDIIAFNQQHADQELPFFGQNTLILANNKGALSNEEYLKALQIAKRLSGPEGIDAALQMHKLDALIAPAYTPAPPIDPVLGDGKIYGSSSPAAVSGYPAITVPAGFDHGLPVGLLFFGAKWSDSELINYAYAFEQGHQAFKAPQFLPTVSTNR